MQGRRVVAFVQILEGVEECAKRRGGLTVKQGKPKLWGFLVHRSLSDGSCWALSGILTGRGKMLCHQGAFLCEPFC